MKFTESFLERKNSSREEECQIEFRDLREQTEEETLNFIIHVSIRRLQEYL